MARILVIIGIIALVGEFAYLEYQWLNYVDEVIMNYEPGKSGK